MHQVAHAVKRAAALACMLALLALAVSCCSSLAAHTAASEGPAAPLDNDDSSSAHAPADWRLLFCPPVLTPWSFDYLQLAWLRAATLVNATAEDEGRVPQPSQPRSRKLLQPGAPPAVVNASAQLTAAQLAAVRRFSTWSPGSMPWIDANAVYVRLYKSGNDMFKANIMAFNNDSEPFTVDAAEVVTRRARNASLLTFTFVREPLARFASGYGEVSFRSVFFPNAHEHYTRPGVSHVRLQHGSKARFRAFLHDLLQGAPVLDAEHVYTSVGALAMGVDFIGHLERFDADFARLLRRLQLPADTAFNRSAGAHASSADPTGDRAAATAVLREDADAAAAVCLLMLPDLACLGYELPPACVPEVRRLASELLAWRSATGQRHK